MDEKDELVESQSKRRTPTTRRCRLCCLSVRNHHRPATAGTNSGTPAPEIQIIKESKVQFICAQPLIQCVFR
jgi:hypothetical protein